MSADEQHEATKRARGHRAEAERLLAESDDGYGYERAVVHLLLAIEDRLTYGYVSILDGTISCKICRVILLEANEAGHYQWHAGSDLP